MPTETAHAGPAHAGILRVTVATATALLLVGCGTASPGSGSPGSKGSGSGVPGGRAALTVARDGANGKTIRLGVGARLELTLSSTYWTLKGSSAPAVIRQDGRVRVLPRPSSCPSLPGFGCAPIQALFTAVAPGTAVITASRTTCGEALACQPSQRKFRVTIVVR